MTYSETKADVYWKDHNEVDARHIGDALDLDGWLTDPVPPDEDGDTVRYVDIGEIADHFGWSLSRANTVIHTHRHQLTSETGVLAHDWRDGRSIYFLTLDPKAVRAYQLERIRTDITRMSVSLEIQRRMVKAHPPRSKARTAAKMYVSLLEGSINQQQLIQDTYLTTV